MQGLWDRAVPQRGKIFLSRGWPSFFEPLAGDRVVYLEDHSIPGRPRVEVRCAACNSHLGHVFRGEGYDTPTDERYCINSICLRLVPARHQTSPGEDT